MEPKKQYIVRYGRRHGEGLYLCSNEPLTHGIASANCWKAHKRGAFRYDSYASAARAAKALKHARVVTVKKTKLTAKERNHRMGYIKALKDMAQAVGYLYKLDELFDDSTQLYNDGIHDARMLIQEKLARLTTLSDPISTPQLPSL